MLERHENCQEIVASIKRNLVSFGYRELTTETVLASYDKAMAGQRPANIIGMMTREQLKQNGYLEG